VLTAQPSHLKPPAPIPSFAMTLFGRLAEHSLAVAWPVMACLASTELMFTVLETSRSVQAPCVCFRKLRSSAAGNKAEVAICFPRPTCGIDNCSISVSEPLSRALCSQRLADADGRLPHRARRVHAHFRHVNLCVGDPSFVLIDSGWLDYGIIWVINTGLQIFGRRSSFSKQRENIALTDRGRNPHYSPTLNKAPRQELLEEAEAQQRFKTSYTLFHIRCKDTWYQAEKVRRENRHRIVAAKLRHSADKVDPGDAILNHAGGNQG
jgi:hypothetical protein